MVKLVERDCFLLYSLFTNYLFQFVLMVHYHRIVTFSYTTSPSTGCAKFLFIFMYISIGPYIHIQFSFFYLFFCWLPPSILLYSWSSAKSIVQLRLKKKSIGSAHVRNQYVQKWKWGNSKDFHYAKDQQTKDSFSSD